YGFPEPERTEAGHRRYRPDVIDRLRLTRRAVDAGHRPSDVVGLPAEALEQLLEDSEPGAERGTDAQTKSWLDEAFAATTGFDVQTLEQLFQHAWDHSGALPFLTDYAAPFLERLGAGWASGLLGIGDEHLASHKLRQLLSDRWRTLAQRTSGPVVLLATPENELHSGGLHMAAVVFALAGWRIVYLGANTPKESVVTAATDSEVSVVG
ncbi:MAG: hypothetical protein ABEN55_13700, partial [Bradymonadaceae bacterium]